MNLDELTYGEIKQIAAMVNGPAPVNDHPFEIGKPYLIRTVTHIQTGRVKRVTPTEIVLTEAAWIADTGRFSEQWAESAEEIFNEVEPFPSGNDVIVGRGALIDATQINALPTGQK